MAQGLGGGSQIQIPGGGINLSGEEPSSTGVKRRRQ